MSSLSRKLISQRYSPTASSDSKLYNPASLIQADKPGVRRHIVLSAIILLTHSL
jgi:hypothetical protein